jgi:hypothetical protein
MANTLEVGCHVWLFASDCLNAINDIASKVFFSQLVFFTRGHQNFRLPRNLENLGNLPDEIIQINFEFEIF